MPISDEHPQYQDMMNRGQWQLIEDLDNGTPAMRERLYEYLPQEVEEPTDDYVRRGKRAFLYEGFRNSLNRTVSLPFSKKMVLNGDLPSELEFLEENADGTGKSFTNVSKEIFRNAIKYGMCHIFIDYPSVPDDLSEADVRQLNIQARVIPITPKQLFNWTIGYDAITQVPTLSSVRFYEFRDEQDEKDYLKTKTVRYIRRVTKFTWELYKEIGTSVDLKSNQGTVGKFELVSSGVHDFGQVPLLTYYTSQTGLMTADPPLRDLAVVNLIHFQSYAEHRNILRFARIGILAGAGFDKEDNIVVSPNRFTGNPRAESKLYYVEYGGKALEAGFKDIDDLERKMEILGNMPFNRVNRSKTSATGEFGDEAKTTTPIQEWLLDLEKVLVKVLEYVGIWHKVSLPEGFKVNIFSDFRVNLFGNLDANLLLKTYVNKGLSIPTYLRELQRRGILSDEVMPEEEEKKVLEFSMEQAKLLGIQSRMDKSMAAEQAAEASAEAEEN